MPAMLSVAFLDSCKTAARICGDRTWDDMRWEIGAYAKRNNMAHPKAKKLLASGDFASLAEQLVRDKKTLKEIYGGNPRKMIEYLLAIGRLEQESFERPPCHHRDGKPATNRRCDILPES